LCDETQNIFKMAAQGSKVRQKDNKWKSKSKAHSKTNKLLRMELKRVRASRIKWRESYKRLKSSQKGESVQGHPYSLELMTLGIVLHISYNISLRATAKALYSVGLMYGNEVKKLSATTIRNWSLRMGLYYLSQKIDAGRYVLIADESISMGQEKLLVMLLVKIDNAVSHRVAPLEMAEVSVLHIQAKSSWKGADISTIIKEKVGKNEGLDIAYALSDKGSNLRNAFKLSGLTWVNDCTHLLSNCTQELYQKDEALNALIKAMNGSRAKWALSHLAVYTPPALRKKARFHQIFAIYKWADMILEKWTLLPQAAKDELIYLKEHQKIIQTMKQIHGLIEDFSALVKGKGIHSHTEALWHLMYEKRCKEWTDKQGYMDTKIEKYHQTIVDYIIETKKLLLDESQILCCSDIIESMFGKYKNKGMASIITDDALKMAAYPHKIQKKEVNRAMVETKNKAVKKWKKENTTVSLMAQKLAFKKKMAA
jgi:hypothetical protein